MSPTSPDRQRSRRWSSALTVAALTGAAALAGGPAAVAGTPSPSAPPASPAAAGSAPSVQVVHTGAAPTGYSVTFRFYDPTATSIRIKAEWSFSSAADIAADPSNPAPRYGTTWRPGDFPLSSPNAGSAANWPVVDLTEDATGVWSYTTPLPSGVFNYAFYRDCTAAAPALTGCTPLADPFNPPWTTAGSAENTSQVYVPSDPAFGSEDLSWQAPVTDGTGGALTHLTYAVPGHAAPVDQNYVSVYTPPGYDPKRATAYPTLYLVHGGGGNEVDWSTQGALDDIMDHLIGSGQVQPMVVVMPNNPTSREVVDNLIPFIQSSFHVATTADQRAFAGLSGGATVVQDELFHDTARFGSYAVWSAPRGLPTAGEENSPALKQLRSLHVAVAIQDLGGAAQGNITTEQSLLRAAGVPFRAFNVNGGHNWSYWRAALRDFVTHTEFRASTSLTATSKKKSYGRPTQIVVSTGVPTASGKLTVLNGSTPLATGTLAGGTGIATVPARALKPGKHTLTVAYAGNDAVAPTQQQVSVTVTKAKGRISVRRPHHVSSSSHGSRLVVVVKGGGKLAAGRVRLTTAGRTLVAKLHHGRATFSLPHADGPAKLRIAYLGSGTVKPVSKKIANPGTRP